MSVFIKYNKISILIIILILLPSCSNNSIEYGWNINKLHINDIWEFSKGSSQTIAFIDTGISAELFNNYNDRIVSPYNVLDSNYDVTDKNGHGTEMIVAACSSGTKGVWGIAPEVKIMPILIMDDKGQSSPENLIKGINWAVDHNATIINLSLGNPIQNSLIENVIKRAIKKKIIFVASAGDYSQSDLLFPASMPEVISVQALKRDGELLPISNHSPEASISAPGYDIPVLTLDKNRKLICKNVSGTSVATAIISGLVALSLDIKKNISQEQIIKALKESLQNDNFIDSKKFIDIIRNN